MDFVSILYYLRKKAYKTVCMIIMNDHASLKQKKKITTRFFYPESLLTGRHNNMY